MSVPHLPAELWWLGVFLPLMAFGGAFAAMLLSRLGGDGTAADLRRLATEVERFAESRRERRRDGDPAESAKD